MTTFLQAIILVAIASIAILVIYLIDRVNTLQRYTRLLQNDLGEVEDPSAGPFGGLSGERLWDAVSGVPIEGWDKNSIDLVRNRYQLVLRKHVEELFLEGFQNAQAGIQAIPSSSRVIQTLRGAVESWIPIESAIAIHQSGIDRAKAADDGLPKVRGALDDAASAIFSQAGIKLPRPMSEHLIPFTEAEQAQQAAAAAAQQAIALPSGQPGTGASTAAISGPVAAGAAGLPQLSAAPAAPQEPAQPAPNVGAAMAAALGAADPPRSPRS